MFGVIARRLFGTANDRFLKPLQNHVAAISALEPELEALSDADLRARTEIFKQRLADGETLDDILVESFATVREAAKRVLGLRPFDVQLVGGMVLHQGRISEMKTGEGKTLTATLPVYLHALSGKGAHVVTVNDYLAERDSAWMAKVYNFLGLSTGVIKHGMMDDERRAAYACDVTYATNNELGFDHLRDNMKFTLEEMVQRGHNFAIVDEVDSILIDEARTPLIISGPAEDSSELYKSIDALLPKLSKDDYEKDEKSKAVTLTDEGTEKVEDLLREEGLLTEGNMYDVGNISLVHHVNQALRAHTMFQRDTDYIVKDDKIVIIDEFTGRMMEGRRYSEGLHQALEAKEKVTVQNENQTLASVTFQNYFRMYETLAGMTGTAMTEAGEFGEIYNLEVLEIPTNVPCIREDQDDQVFRTLGEKDNAITDLIGECQKKGQPVLVGTVSIERSEELSEQLKAKGFEHSVLNARYHEQEAHIVTQAGNPGAVTIATNMAGRGTDIQLGGNLEARIKSELGEDPSESDIDRIKAEIAANRQIVLDAGGLMIIGTERHESRRIDNQLRGRAGRQGDPGASAFFLSLEDDLMRIFGSDRIDSMLQKLGLEEGEAIVHPWINKALEKAQQKVEARNFDIRKNLLKFDDVMNDQRKVIFEQRREIMDTDDVSAEVVGMRHTVIEDLVTRCIPEKAYAEQWDIDGLHEECVRLFNLDLPFKDWAKEEGIADSEILERLIRAADEKNAEKVGNYGADVMRSVEKSLLLQLLDQLWKEHLHTLDMLRQGIGLRAYAQRDPLNEYKREAFNLFEEMLNVLRDRVTMMLSRLDLQVAPSEDDLTPQAPQGVESHVDPAFASLGDMAEGEVTGTKVESSNIGKAQPMRHAAADINPADPDTWGKVSRNAPCPCGSGNKYKHCHGKLS